MRLLGEWQNAISLKFVVIGKMLRDFVFKVPRHEENTIRLCRHHVVRFLDWNMRTSRKPSLLQRVKIDNHGHDVGCDPAENINSVELRADAPQPAIFRPLLFSSFKIAMSLSRCAIERAAKSFQLENSFVLAAFSACRYFTTFIEGVTSPFRA